MCRSVDDTNQSLKLNRFRDICSYFNSYIILARVLVPQPPLHINLAFRPACTAARWLSASLQLACSHVILNLQLHRLPVTRKRPRQTCGLMDRLHMYVPPRTSGLITVGANGTVGPSRHRRVAHSSHDCATLGPVPWPPRASLYTLSCIQQLGNDALRCTSCWWLHIARHRDPQRRRLSDLTTAWRRRCLQQIAVRTPRQEDARQHSVRHVACARDNQCNACGAAPAKRINVRMRTRRAPHMAVRKKLPLAFK